MNPEDIVKVLRQIGELLEPGAQQVWGIAMRQAVLEGWVMLILGLILIMTALVLLSKIMWWVSHQECCSQYEGRIGASATAGSVFTIVGLILTPLGLMQLVNPAYYAIDILRRFVR